MYLYQFIVLSCHYYILYIYTIKSLLISRLVVSLLNFKVTFKVIELHLLLGQL